MIDKSSAEIHPSLPHLIAKLKELGAKRVILYGSRAREDHASRSDIDLAVDAPDIDRTIWSRMEDLAEETETLYKIDCVWLQNIPDDLKNNILRDGKVIYEHTT